MNNFTVEQALEQNKGCIKSIALKWLAPPRITMEDLLQVGNIAVINAWKKYDPNQGTKFSTYAYKAIKNAIIKYYKENRYTTYCSAFNQKNKENQQFVIDQEKNTFFIDGEEKEIDVPHENDPCNNAHREELIRILKNNIDKLDDKDKFLIYNSNSFLGNKTLDEIGKKLLITRQGTKFRVVKLQNKLREMIGEIDV